MPTSVNADNVPDLRLVRAASCMIAANCTPIVVFESTVYLGVTKDLYCWSVS